MMKMNDVRVSYVKFSFRRNNQSKDVIANCMVKINNAFTINGIKLMLNKERNEYYLIFPAYKTEDRFFPIIQVEIYVRELILQAILNRYNEMRRKGHWVNAS